jgi:DNA-binding Xre family transcriptional regulator
MRIGVRIVSSYKWFICYVRDLYDTICEFISDKWIGSKARSVRAFATNHDIDEKTVRRIKDWKTTPYRITLYTLEKICSSRDITLEEFFKMIKR